MTVALCKFGPNLFIIIIGELLQSDEKAGADYEVIPSRLFEADRYMDRNLVDCRICKDRCWCAQRQVDKKGIADECKKKTTKQHDCHC